MRTLIVILLVLMISCKVKKDKPEIIFADLSEDIVSPKHYIVTKTGDHIIIDGIADEEAWKQTPFSDPFVDIEGVKPVKYDTKVKMLWDEKYLYVYAYLEEPHIWADITEKDAIIYYNNDFEIFIDPAGKTVNYGEIEINALGTVWDLMLNRPYRFGGKPISSWNLNDMKTSVHIEGSLNDPNDEDSFWSVEAAIPLKALQELKGRPRQLPQDGDQWRINFSRVEWEHETIDGKYRRKKENGSYLPEYNWVWSAQQVIDMHQPDKWGVLQFSTKEHTKDIVFKHDPDMTYKLMAYSLVRQTQRGQFNALKDSEAGNDQLIHIKYSENDTTNVRFFKTIYGYEYQILSPVSEQVYIINQSGILKTQQ